MCELIDWLYMELSAITKSIGKYVFPVLILIAGIVLLSEGMKSTSIERVECGVETIDVTVEQNEYFKFGGYGLFAMAVVLFLFNIRVINRVVALILALTVFPLVFGIASYYTYDAVETQVAWEDEKDRVEKAIKQNLKDIRDAQLEFKLKYGRYATDLNELENFLRHEKVANIKKQGTPPDRKIMLKEAFLLGEDTTTFLIDKITELQAVKLGNIARDPSKQELINELFTDPAKKQQFMELASIIRDTTYVDVVDKLFIGPEAKKRDENYPFDLDSVKFRPFSGGEIEFWMRADSLMREDSTFVHVFMVKDPQPYKKRYLDPDAECQPRDTLTMGSLTSTSTNGNWK